MSRRERPRAWEQCRRITIRLDAADWLLLDNAADNKYLETVPYIERILKTWCKTTRGLSDELDELARRTFMGKPIGGMSQ